MPHPCDIPASETCEAFKCPTWASRQPWPIGDEVCITYLRDKRAGNLTTAEEIQRAQRSQQDLVSRLQVQTISRQEEERAASVRQQLNQELQSQQLEDEQKRALFARNKKILGVGAAIVGTLLIGAVILRRR